MALGLQAAHTVSARVSYAYLAFAHLALGRDLLMVAVRGVTGDLTGPQCNPHHSVRVADHQ